jgi:hypothetical protein
MFVGDLGKCLDVADVAGGIADAFAEDGAGLALITLAMSRGWSLAAKRELMPSVGKMCAKSVCVVP